MVIALVGSNSFALKRRLSELVESFVTKHGELALERIDASEAGVEVIIDAVQSVPLLSDKKMVVIRGLGANKPAAEKIEQIISAAGSNDLVIYDPDTDRRTSYFKTLQKTTSLEVLNEADPRTLASWIVSETAEQGGEISIQDANYLIERVGTDQNRLFNELDKLITYGRQVTRGNIELLTEQAAQSRVFDLLDAAFSGYKQKALQLYEEQRAQKVEPQAILAMIVWQLHLLAAAKLGEGKPPAEIARDFNMKPYPISKAASLAKRISEKKLSELVGEVFEIDLKNKTRSVDLDEALKTYIVTI